MKNNSGIIYVVATPIGNLQDITLRALDTLKQVDSVLAEDTRCTKRLLQHYDISQKKVVSLHAYNEKKKSELILERIEEGHSVALVSDAGTPLISDPGYFFIKEAHNRSIPVVPIPGASALVAALSASGLLANRFIFEGFLPAKSGARCKRLEILKEEEQTMAFYEVPHRIIDTLKDMIEYFGGKREVVLNRELTKKFETVQRGTLKELLDFVEANPNQQKGEFVLVLSGKDSNVSKETSLTSEANKILVLLLAELSLKQAVKITAQITGVQKKLLYTAALEIQGKD